MEHNETGNELPEPTVKIRLGETFCGKYRVFAGFLICLALITAAFAATMLCAGSGFPDWLRGWGAFRRETSGESSGGTPVSTEGQDGGTELPEKAPDLPEGKIAVVSADLSAPSLGKTYLHNETAFTPDVEKLMDFPLADAGAFGGEPVVLILHTHTGESYLPAGAISVSAEPGDETFSRNAAENVLAVGEALTDALARRGIVAIHCVTEHDSPSFGGSYARAAESIRFFLNEYPTIRYCIDLHRDSVLTADGELVRSASPAGNAQILPVVGTDANGTAFPGDGWEGNLAFSLQLREKLNADGEALCRPVSLRNASFNQELCERSLLLEIGTAGNSPEEAKAAANSVAAAFAEILAGK